MRGPRSVAISLGWALVACAPELEAGPLTDPSGWVEVAPADDPYDDRPAGAGCEPHGWVLEGELVEVQTDVCAYVTLRQPLRRGVRAGESVVVDAWNLGLWAEAPASAHASVQLGEERWEARPRIPSPPGYWSARFEPRAPLPAGTPIYLHVHNHGANSWRFAPPRTR